MEVRVCVVLLVLGGAVALSGKGFYCRDPDTGKLHPVNTTWLSTTFCGNYTCKLKKKDLNDKVPIREFQVSNVDISNINIPQIENKITEVQNVTNENKRVSTILDKILSSINEPPQKKQNNDETHKAKTDRFLNDKEVKLISDMLYGVKKSDLEAVVDIYNLAQDIYQELDKKTTESLLEETVNAIRNEKQVPSTPIPKLSHEKLSYFYEPLLEQKVKPILDMNTAGSDSVLSVYPIQKYEHPSPRYSPSAVQNYGKLPYYYDMSEFQRQASYLHPTSPNPVTPVATQIINEKLSQNSLVSPFTDNQYIQQPLLPYPYFNVHYNATAYPYHYYYTFNSYPSNSKSLYDSYYVTPYTVKANVPDKDKYTDWNIPDRPIADVIPEKSISEKPILDANSPERSYKQGSLLDTLLPFNDSKKKKIPDWKTNSLTEDVLEDIRAHLDNKNVLFRPLCLRKKIKLEKVGRVFKLEDVNRDKRSISEEGPLNAQNVDEFEVYIEKTTCQSDVDPGFFRMGNDSAPFPACCPQRINR